MISKIQSGASNGTFALSAVIGGTNSGNTNGTFTGVALNGGGLTVADINAMTNVQVTCELANGKTIVGGQMWTVESQDVDTSEASFDVTWEGLSVTEE